MREMSIREVTRENWREAVCLTVAPEQQRFVAGNDIPVVALALTKAYIRPGGLTWSPYVFYDGTSMVGFTSFAHKPGSDASYFLCHFFIDHRYQGRGYGKEALSLFIQFVRQHYPRCQTIRLTVHPENFVAQKLYERAGFRRTGEQSDGEPVYVLRMEE
jgi:diamine N-acetyltransferase